MQRRLVTVVVCVLGIIVGALPGGVLQATSGSADVTSAVTLNAPTLVHSNGAELQWSAFAESQPVSLFTRYEIYRSTDPSFTPTPATLIGTVGDEATTTFVDSTAAPSQSFTYRVSVSGIASNPVTITTPADGRARLTVTGRPGISDSYIEHAAGSPSPCSLQTNYGSASNVRVGVYSSGAVDRGLLGFDVKDIDAGATVLSASLSLPYAAGSPAATVDVARLQTAWTEGTEQGSCAQTGASWQSASPGIDWHSAGGDATSPATASISHLGGAAGTDSVDVTNLLQSWADGSASDFGVLLSFNSEAAGSSDKLIDYAASESGGGPSLSVLYTDGSHAVAPSPAIIRPQANAIVAGPSVGLFGRTGDDGSTTTASFAIDGTQIPTATPPTAGSFSTTPVVATLNTTTISDGVHTLTMTATDNAGQTSTTSEQIVVDNLPTTSAPAAFQDPPATAAGTVPVSAQIAVDPAQVWYVTWSVDGHIFDAGQNTSVHFVIPPIERASQPPRSAVDIVPAPEGEGVWQYSTTWNTLDSTHPSFDGPHTLVADFYDADGVRLSRATTAVVVDNTASTAFQATYGFGAGNSALSDVIPRVVLASTRSNTAPLGINTAPVDSTGGAAVPATCPVDSYCPTVTVTNTSSASWFGAQLWYRWINANGDVAYQAPATGLPAVVTAGTATAVPVTVTRRRCRQTSGPRR